MADFEIKKGTSKADKFAINFDGNCTVYGYEGNDTIEFGVDYQHAPNNVAYGGDGNDYLVAKEISKLYGEDDDDILIIGVSNIFAHGGNGDDNIIIKPSQNSILYGGRGADTYVVQPQSSDYLSSKIMDLTNDDVLLIDSSAKNFTYKISDGNIIFSDENKSFNLTFDGITDISQVANVKVSYFLGNNETTLGKLFGKSSTVQAPSKNDDDEEIFSSTATTKLLDTDEEIIPTVKTVEETTTTPTIKTKTSTATTPIDELTTTTKSENATIPSSSNSFVVNNYYGDTYNVNDSGTVVISSSVTDNVTTNTSTTNIANINTTNTANTTTTTTFNTTNTNIINNINNIYTYSGGNKTISSYAEGQVVKLSDYQGLGDLKGTSFYIKSKNGTLEIQNARDKFIGYSATNTDVVAYSYLASGGGQIDGYGKSQAKILIGGDNANNQIYAGNDGSSLWGGNGGADTLTGGNGYDEFFYAIGSGNDVVKNAGDNDVVNLLGVSLSQISGFSYDSSSVDLNFNDGGHLKVESTSSVGYRVENQTFYFNRSTNEWATK